MNQQMKVKLIYTTEPFITIPKRTKYMNGIKYTTTKLYLDSNHLLWESTTNAKDSHFAKTKHLYF